MKTTLIAMALLASTFSTFATKLVSKNGQVKFYSHTAIEDIEAQNRQSVSILDSETGDMQISILIKSFEFKVALMQEHFNENYMESSKFPKASFKGKVDQITNINFKADGVYTSSVTGEITIHGVTKTLTVTGTFEVNGSNVTARAKFTVSPKEFDISIPSLVENKIAKDIEITVEFPYII